MAKGKYDRDGCVALLTTKAAELAAAGEDRQPKRSDFADGDVVAIKAFFGPWPRALEAAGLKEPRSGNRLEHNREKRIRAKRRQTELLKAAKKDARSEGDSPAEKADGKRDKNDS